MAADAPTLIEAALNGVTSRVVQPAVPETPEEVAEEAARCAAAGASVVHIHARGTAGPAAEARWYAATISAWQAGQRIVHGAVLQLPFVVEPGGDVLLDHHHLAHPPLLVGDRGEGALQPAWLASVAGAGGLDAQRRRGDGPADGGLAHERDESRGLEDRVGEDVASLRVADRPLPERVPGGVGPQGGAVGGEDVAGDRRLLQHRRQPQLRRIAVHRRGPNRQAPMSRAAASRELDSSALRRARDRHGGARA
jgi:hypothetical protein